MIRAATVNDAANIADIYNYYIKHTTVTFEEQPVSASVMRDRITEILPKFPWLVYVEKGTILGYAYAMPWRIRAAYRFSVETSVYLRHGHTGKGLGTLLYEALLQKLTESNFHGVIGGIALPNDACIGLHKMFGFTQVAHFREVGFKFERWIDVAYFEKILHNDPVN